MKKSNRYLVALFCLGKHLETTRFYAVARILRFMAIALCVFGAVQAVLSLLGVYG